MTYLTRNLPKIMKHIEFVQKNQTIYEAKLLEIFEGSLQKYVEESLAAELGAGAVKQVKHRIAPINIMPKILKKLSAVYGYGITRLANGNDIDQENVSYYENELALDSVMNLANKYLNLFRYCAIEPYINKGKPSIRVLPPTSFTVWTDNKVNPLEPTVFVKYIGKVEDTLPRTTTEGVSNSRPDNIVDEIDIFHMYTDEEFLVVDGKGHVRGDMMGENAGINHYGRIPFVYMNVSKNLLIPLPNSDFFQMTVLTPKLLSDLNFATKFQSHAIMYTIDIESGKLDGNPNAMWELKSEEGEGKNPSVGTIKPEVDVDKVLSLIKDTLGLWFDSLGMKSSGINGITAESAQSGIAKAIDNSDITEVREEQIPMMKKYELELWDLIGVQHEVWGSELEELKPFSTAFDPSLQYGEPEPFVDTKTQTETAKIKLDAGLTSFRRAVAEANPSLNAEEVQELMDEIEQEKADRAAVAQAAFGNAPDDEEETETELTIPEEPTDG